MSVAIIPERQSSGFGWLAGLFTVILAFLILSPIYFIFISAKPEIPKDVSESVTASSFLLNLNTTHSKEYIVSSKLKVYGQKIDIGSPSKANPFLSL